MSQQPSKINKPLFSKKYLLLPFAFFLSLNLTGCSSAASITAQLGYTKESADLMSPSVVNSIRLSALSDTATTLGAQGALAWRSQQIDNLLQKNATHLDIIFNFNQLLINKNLLPPVLTQSNNNYKQTSEDTIRLNKKTYKILRPAKFVTVAPTWRDYLVMSYPAPEQPDRSLLPKNKAEIKAWNGYMKIGWNQGLTQANEIYQENLNRLKRDFNGIVLYKKLLQKRMINAPFVAKAKLGVTGDSKEINIDDQVIHITKKSGLSTDYSKWRSLLTNKHSILKVNLPI